MGLSIGGGSSAEVCFVYFAIPCLWKCILVLFIASLISRVAESFGLYAWLRFTGSISAWKNTAFNRFLKKNNLYLTYYHYDYYLPTLFNFVCRYLSSYFCQ